MQVANWHQRLRHLKIPPQIQISKGTHIVLDGRIRFKASSLQDGLDLERWTIWKTYITINIAILPVITVNTVKIIMTIN